MEFAAFFYGLLAMFVLTSMQRNVENDRPHAPALALAGWGLLSSSATFGVLLFGYATYRVLSGQ